MRNWLKLAALGATFLVSPVYAGTYDATGTSVTYGPGLFSEATTGGLLTTPTSLADALSSASGLTIEVRFKISGNPSSTQVMVGNKNLGWFGVTTSGNLTFVNNGTDGGQYTLTTSGTVTDGQWHTATMVIGTGAMVGYLDGESVGIASTNIKTVPAGTQFGLRGFEDGGFGFTGTIDEVSFWNIVRSWQGWTPEDAPFQGIEPGLLALYHLNNDTTDSVTSSVQASFSDGTVYFSPYNWGALSDTSKDSINAGAYFKTTFSGENCALAFSTYGESEPLTQVSVSVDGMDAKTYPVRGSIPCTPSSLVSTSVHSLRVSLKSTSEGLIRWATTPGTRAELTGISIGASQSFYAPKVYPRTLLFYGDSITEGVRTLGETQAYDTNRNDNAVEWSAQVAQRLNAEYGIVGFGGTGLTVGGSGGVPSLPNTWSQVFPGQNRSFALCPDAMIENEGTNDANATTSSVQAAETSFLTAFSSMCPFTKSIVMRPFNGAQWQALQASVAEMGSRNISLLDTTGFMNTVMGVDSLGVHPTANNAVNYLAPQAAAAVRQIIEAQPSQTYTFR
ncbi:lysophospholipase L1-like esterase [Gluconobacter cerinus]|uniref:LamG-like jellyroll fold domain-containing protein n=1 Tax=Gluconobacter cerinus TaxID=38307 RepID=UPI002226834B|nr:LamG-like jellyroll fold domain-containing protein [Gluconobacter cerinus]MCW2264162.1 lysophospholipase L1-like esterase [Gluconobacter cerinus]